MNNNGQPVPGWHQQYQQHQQNQYPQYPQSQPNPQAPQYIPGYQYYHGAYPNGQNYYPPNPPGYKPAKKKSRVKRAILFLILLAALSAAAWHFGRPVWHMAERFYWQNQWRFVKGKAQNEKEINKMMEEFASTLERRDADGASAFVHPDKAEAYKEMFKAKPEGMIALASIIRSIEGIKMTEETDLDNVKGRIAEVKVIYNGTEFEIQLIKVNDTWYVFNI